jgi:hypothetical protein
MLLEPNGNVGMSGGQIGVTDLQGFGTVMGTGIAMFCPSHTDEMKQFLTAEARPTRHPKPRRSSTQTGCFRGEVRLPTTLGAGGSHPV